MSHLQCYLLFTAQSHLDNWVKIAPLTKGRWRHRMVTLGGHVYCIGGYDGKNKLKSVEKYDRYNCITSCRNFSQEHARFSREKWEFRKFGGWKDEYKAEEWKIILSDHRLRSNYVNFYVKPFSINFKKVLSKKQRVSKVRRLTKIWFI